MKASLARRFFVSFVAVAAIVAVVVTVVASLVYQKAFLDDEHDQLAGEAQTIASLLDQGTDDANVLASLDLVGIRATMIAPDGSLLYDSLADASELENHADRPEFRQALATGRGSSERSSRTAGYVSLYEAVRLDSGDVVRLSVDRAGVASFLARDLAGLVALAVAMVVASWVVSERLSSLFVRPILEIDPSAGDGVAPYKELDPLVQRLNEQHAELLSRMEELRSADDMRREFTANVTHELKTPIASISGASELIRDGLVKKGDVRDFARRIYDDAQRLSALVSDILTLSKLDESERVGNPEIFGTTERVDLLSVARQAASRLSPRADDAQVTLSVEGVDTPLVGNARLLDELVSNLVENAVRYNRPGGSVYVWVIPKDGHPCLRVSDTGIGIPKESQAKVFERFYRVDKGRSRDMGGTGLGLAIVKHAAAFHGATLELRSEVDKGTTVTVTFPVPGV